LDHMAATTGADNLVAAEARQVLDTLPAVAR
jgi:hypothetical protein